MNIKLYLQIYGPTHVRKLAELFGIAAVVQAANSGWILVDENRTAHLKGAK